LILEATINFPKVQSIYDPEASGLFFPEDTKGLEFNYSSFAVLRIEIYKTTLIL